MTYSSFDLAATEIINPVFQVSRYTGRLSYSVTNDATSPGNISVRCLGINGSSTEEIQPPDLVAPGASITRDVDVGGFESVGLGITGPGKVASIEANTAF